MVGAVGTFTQSFRHELKLGEQQHARNCNDVVIPSPFLWTNRRA